MVEYSKLVPEYITSVGLEVHAELLTESKMFCRCEVGFGGQPNTRVCPVCIGLPGTLPVPNHRAIEMVMKTALALNCKIPRDSVFHRKNYFYPDLPKGFQVSQYDETNPIGYHGFLDIPTANGGTKRVKIRRVHLEEDTGKLMHLPGGGSGVDYNRAGVPLMEIVTDFPPDVENGDEAKEYLQYLRLLLIYLGVCNGKLEEGSMRCEPNISVRPVGAEKYGTKTELKNLNSFRSVQLGIEFETARQIEVYESGGKVLQETRGWNESTLSSYAMRLKEEEMEYRYFPCPDLVPMHFTDEVIDSVRHSLPEMPFAKQQRYMNDLGLSSYDAGVLISDLEWALFFEEAVSLGGDPKLICNWMNGDFAANLKESGQVARSSGRTSEEVISKVTPALIVELVGLITDEIITGKIAKELFVDIFETGESPKALVESKGLVVITDEGAISKAIAEVLAENPGQLEQYRNGKEGLFGFFVGQTMRKTGGRANPKVVQEELKKQLG